MSKYISSFPRLDQRTYRLHKTIGRMYEKQRKNQPNLINKGHAIEKTKSRGVP